MKRMIANGTNKKLRLLRTRRTRNDNCCNDKKNKYTYFFRRSLRIPKASDIAELLPKFATKGLAAWNDGDRYGG
jgi:hypothetical protein